MQEVITQDDSQEVVAKQIVTYDELRKFVTYTIASVDQIAETLEQSKDVNRHAQGIRAYRDGLQAVKSAVDINLLISGDSRVIATDEEKHKLLVQIIAANQSKK